MDQNKAPVIIIIDEPVNVGFGLPGSSFGETVVEFISGRIDRAGNIQSGTRLPNGQYAFNVISDPNNPGLFRVQLKPELKPKNVSTGPYSGSSITVLELPQSGCCYCQPGFGELVTGKGAAFVSDDNEGFDYVTYEETTLRRRYTPLPVSFKVLISREE
ncbi:hypothetical protein E2R51_09395 [Jeotgalibacillus sp. S-D1]|uniref:hypothetical protein n=1 Tax=Jeotgalibacillus sp. S-D1 TaxID=2552189 RepID=UPI001059B144|nr:hypothetical protein [Jeotgalibacillus sp. S-D1]TDL32871.1 hypothetical protein E2R51_09395 [Jeotgalibacillus sp. S-D1]